VQVHYDERVAIYIGPEPCVGVSEDGGEASVEEGIGQPLSRESQSPGADAVSSAEGKTFRTRRSAIATRELRLLRFRLYRDGFLSHFALLSRPETSPCTQRSVAVRDRTLNAQVHSAKARRAHPGSLIDSGPIHRSISAGAFVHLPRMRPAYNAGQISGHCARFVLGQAGYLDLEVLRHQLAQGDALVKKHRCHHPLSKIRRKRLGALHDALGVVTRHLHMRRAWRARSNTLFE
jgi:hypothetical protein